MSFPSEQKHSVFIKFYPSQSKKADNTRATEVFLNNLNIPSLTEHQRLSCEGKITSNECAEALETFKLNKALGNDRIPVQFYNTFWSLISEPFIRCANECFEKSEMSSSQKQAVITLIEKKGNIASFWKIGGQSPLLMSTRKLCLRF